MIDPDLRRAYETEFLERECGLAEGGPYRCALRPVRWSAAGQLRRLQAGPGNERVAATIHHGNPAQI